MNPRILRVMQGPTPNYHKSYIKQWRLFRQMTQEQLADAAELSLSQLNKVENGTAGFSPKSLYAIAYALGCSPGDLFSINPANDADLVIWDLIRTLSDNDKRQLARIWVALRDNRHTA